MRGLGALGLGLGGLSSCTGRTSGLPNLVLLILDTVRADHVSYAGYTRRTTPHLDALVQGATAYRRAYSTAPWTLPSHATLFTGQYSFQHGVEASLRKDAQGKDEVIEPPLPDAAVTLAERLRSLGYATGAFTANLGYMNLWSNLEQGFDVYDVNWRPGAEMVEPVAAWARAHRNDPFFLFVNIMDAHYPYNTQACPGTFGEAIPQDRKLIDRLTAAVLSCEEPPDEQLVRDVTAQYDAGIANADHAAGRMIEHFKRLGVYDNAFVVVAADHGEFLGEHRLMQHSKDVYEEVLRVPLIVKAPEQRTGQWIERPVSLIQVCDTLLGATGISGTRSTGDLEGEAQLLAENNYSRPWDVANPVLGKRFLRRRTAYYEYPWKLIHSSDGNHELYDVEHDPKEATSRFGEMSEKASGMLSRLGAIKPLSAEPAAAMGKPAPDLSERDREALRNLGYL